MGWFLASGVSPLASLFPLLSLLTQTPRAPQQTPASLPTEAAGAGAWRSRRQRGCCEEPPDSRPGIHLQTAVSNNSPSTRRAKTAGGLAEAEVKVNCFTAVLPTQPNCPCPSPQPPPLLPKSQDPKSRRMEFMWGKKVGSRAPSPSCTSVFSGMSTGLRVRSLAQPCCYFMVCLWASLFCSPGLSFHICRI